MYDLINFTLDFILNLYFAFIFAFEVWKLSVDKYV